MKMLPPAGSDAPIHKTKTKLKYKMINHANSVGLPVSSLEPVKLPIPWSTFSPAIYVSDNTYHIAS